MANDKPAPGSVVWCDLTVKDAEAVRDFYSKVVGWQSQPVPMGEYEDYGMGYPAEDGSGEMVPVGGVCHSRGPNADLPPNWMIYVIVEDLDQSLAACNESGGKVISGPREMSPGERFAFIADPAGATLGLYEKG